MEKILKLENTDDMASLRGRINYAFPPRPILVTDGTAQAEAVRLLLIVPRQNRTLQSLVNMKLLARLVTAKGIELAIVSGHPVVRDNAKAVGVKAFGSLRRAKWAGWVPQQTPVAPPGPTLPPKAAEENEPPGSSARVKPKKYEVVQGSGRVNLLQQLGALLLLVIITVGLVFAVMALLPEATVTLTPVAQPVTAELIVKADPEVKSLDFTNLAFPARMQQVELSLAGSINTSDTELAPVGKAAGPIIFINRTEETQIIPISTTLATSAGEPVEFVTVQTATIPAGVGATTSTLAIALEPGPSGNVRPGQINRFIVSAYGLRARVLNEQPFSGGTMAAARIVVEADKERLQAYLREEIRKEGLAQLQAALGEQEFVPAESLQVIVLDVSYAEFSGDFSDTFGGEMQAVVRGTVVGGYNANRLALAALEAQVPAGFKLDIEGLHFGAGEVLDIQGQVVSFRIFADGMAVPVIDQHEVASQISWLPVGEAQARLAERYDLATVPGIELKPEWVVAWLGRLPFFPLRIEVVVNEATTLVAGGQ
jgi:hypothetical protein